MFLKLYFYVKYGRKDFPIDVLETGDDTSVDAGIGILNLTNLTMPYLYLCIRCVALLKRKLLGE